MFVFSFKAATAKFMCAALACIAVSAVAVSLMPDAGHALNVNKIIPGEKVSFKGVDSIEKQVELIENLGFEVENTPVQSGSVSVPKNFDAVLTKYNDLQKKQGFDLAKYRGKNVDRYTYSMKMPEGQNTGAQKSFVTLILYKNKLVGADVCCPATGEYSVLVTP